MFDIKSVYYYLFQFRDKFLKKSNLFPYNFLCNYMRPKNLDNFFFVKRSKSTSSIQQLPKYMVFQSK